MIVEMNQQEKWVHNWKSDPVKTNNVLPKYRVTQGGPKVQIHPIPKNSIDKPNVACRTTMNMLQNTGRRSGRASVTHIRDAGKVSKMSKMSKMSSRHRISAKSSVSRPNLDRMKNNFISNIKNNISAYQDHKYKSP